MSVFSEFLARGAHSGCVLLYGDTTDKILSPDLCFRPFFVALADMLKEAGFDNVVFFDSTNAMGKYVYDDESAYYSMESARSEYLKKYGKVPDKAPPAADASQTKQPAVQGGMIFGRPRKVVSQPQAAPQPAPTAAPSTGTLTYQQRNMQESVFYAECTKILDNGDYRSAVIFTNVHAFLRYSRLRPQYAESLLHYVPGSPGAKNNLMIVVHPDLRNPSDTAFCQALQEISMLHYFLLPAGSGGRTRNLLPNPKRCFSINSLGRDELVNLLFYYKLFFSLRLPESPEEIADKLAYLLKQAEEKLHRPFTMRQLTDDVDHFIHSHPAPTVDDRFYEAVSGLDLKEVDFHPWETLRTTRGWESAAEALRKSILPLRRTQPHTARVSGTASLFTDRIAGENRSAFPQAANMPHFILEGCPGTGKSTIAALIGRILHDEGLLENGFVVHASKGDCVADVVGGTAIKMNALIERAEGGVLFIDEAHMLCEDFEKGGNADIFAQEAIHTLVNAMTDQNRHFCVILAGYKCSTPNSTDGVRGVLKMDQGMEGRLELGGIITLEDYPPDLLTEIFLKKLEDSAFDLDGEVSEKDVLTLMSNIYQSRNRKTFSNARYAVKLAQKVIGNAKARQLDQAASSHLTRADFGEAAELLDEVNVDSVKQELMQFPGLGVIGSQIIDDYMDYCKVQKEIKGSEIPNPKHMVFIGNPGTGKTTIAKMLCKALGAARILSGVDPVEITNVAHISQEELEKNIQDAISLNTVLFIDEAHNCPPRVIQTLLNPMSENSQLTCIFAVYRSKMDQFFKLDSGLHDRCKQYEIEDYTPDQLLEIFQRFAKESHWSCTPECLQQLEVLFQNWYDTRESTPDYSNARKVKNLCDDMLIRSWRRTENSPDAERHTFTVEDLPEKEREIVSSQAGAADFDTVMAEVDTYVGWKPLKDWLLRQKQTIDYAAKYHTVRIVPPGHMTFCGAPGTGKTTAGKLFAEACYQLGILKTRKFKKYVAKDLIAGYVGQTSLKAAEALEAGRHGVIFIDEAYDLATDPMQGGNNSFKADVQSLLLTFTEEHHGDTIVILAGYEDKIEQLLQSNEGLRSRFDTRILFPNYDPAECTEILKRLMEKDGYLLNVQVLQKVEAHFQDIYKLPNFGNGRDVRTIFERILSFHMERIMADEHFSGNHLEITEEDVDAAFQDWNKQNKPSAPSSVFPS